MSAFLPVAAVTYGNGKEVRHMKNVSFRVKQKESYYVNNFLIAIWEHFFKIVFNGLYTGRVTY